MNAIDKYGRSAENVFDLGRNADKREICYICNEKS